VINSRSPAKAKPVGRFRGSPISRTCLPFRLSRSPPRDPSRPHRSHPAFGHSYRHREPPLANAVPAMEALLLRSKRKTAPAPMSATHRFPFSSRATACGWINWSLPGARPAIACAIRPRADPVFSPQSEGGQRSRPRQSSAPPEAGAIPLPPTTREALGAETGERSSSKRSAHIQAQLLKVMSHPRGAGIPACRIAGFPACASRGGA